MNADAILQSIGLGEFLSRDVLGVQLLILALTATLFVFSLAIMIMTMKSAGGARKARHEAEAHIRTAQDFVVEARQLSAQIDRAAARGKVGGADGAAPIRISARETTAEADVEIVDLRHSDVVSNRNLDAAKESATVPKGLLGRSRRR